MELLDRIRHKIATRTKPPGSLGRLEDVAELLCLVQGTDCPQITHPHLVVFAADHGIARAGVSAYPQEVTRQMVANFLAGGAAINVFARQVGMTLRIVDAGVKGDIAPAPELISAKVAHGTQNFAEMPAMTAEQLQTAMARGRVIIDEIAAGGCNVIGFGEMGIGNTTSAAVIMHCISEIPIEDCIGRGTGLDDAGLLRKLTVVHNALATHGTPPIITRILELYGGFEIAMMCAAMEQAVAHRMVVLVDGFIATTAALAAIRSTPAVRQHCLFAHCSAERGHRTLLDYLQATPLLQLDMRLGEGTGAALALPLVHAAANFVNEMASFSSAGVSDRDGSA